MILDDALSAEEYGVGFKKGEHRAARQGSEDPGGDGPDGTLKAISEKWFSEDVTTIGKKPGIETE